MTQRPGPTPPRQFSSVATRRSWRSAPSSDYPTNIGASFCCAIAKNLILRRPRDLSRLRRTPSRCGSIGLGRHSKRSSSESLRSRRMSRAIRAHLLEIAAHRSNPMKNVSSSKILTLLAIGLALGISGCAAVEAARSAEVEKQKSFEHRVDTAHIWVTTQSAPAGKPYSTLGELNYTEPFSPDAD